MADFAHRATHLVDHAEKLHRREQPVAGRGEIGKDDVAGLLAPEIEAVLAHMFEHVAIADGGARQRQADRAGPPTYVRARRGRGGGGAQATAGASRETAPGRDST